VDGEKGKEVQEGTHRNEVKAFRGLGGGNQRRLAESFASTRIASAAERITSPGKGKKKPQYSFPFAPKRKGSLHLTLEETLGIWCWTKNLLFHTLLRPCCEAFLCLFRHVIGLGL